MTRDEEIDAVRAQQLLEDPLLQRLFGEEAMACYGRLLETREATPEADALRRELIDRVNTINGVLGRLGTKVAAAKQSARPRMGIA